MAVVGPESNEVMYSYIMLRTQISLTESDRALLDREAARTGRSIASLIRDAVVQVYGGGAGDMDVDLRAIDGAFGAWGADRTDGATYVEGIRTGARLRASTER